MVYGGGRMDKQKDGRMDVSKFPPVFYRTSALWGRCPKSKSSKDRTWSAVPDALLSYPVKKWSESRAAALKSRCPLEHRCPVVAISGFR